MKVVQCPNGHYYNQEISPFCPVCGKNPDGDQENEASVQAYAQTSSNVSAAVTAGFGNPESEDITVSIFDEVENEDSLTVMMTDEGKIWSPVVGWIVCVEGGSKGRDFRIHSQRNFIGRAGDMDICIVDDDKIAMRYHCSIVHEPVKNEFMLVPGEETFTYYNGKAIEKYVKLSEGDKFTIGGSTFAFVPYCKGDVSW